MTDIQEVLQTAKTIAVVGCSTRTTQTSYRIARYLKSVGYRMIPVNPYHDEVLGEPCYPDLASIPDDVRIDVVNVFRKPQFTEAVVQDAAERAERTGERPAIWTQIGVSSPQARQRAEEAGLPYIADRCIMIDHGSLR